MSLSGYRRSGLRAASLAAIAALAIGFAPSVAASSGPSIALTCAVGGNTTASWSHFGVQTATVTWWTFGGGSMVASTGPFTVHGGSLSVPTNSNVTTTDHAVVELSRKGLTLSTDMDCF